MTSNTSANGAAAAAALNGATTTTTTPALICPILISQNVFFASEIIAAGTEGSGGAKLGGGGVGTSLGRSFVSRVCPVQLRFEPYSPVSRSSIFCCAHTNNSFKAQYTITSLCPFSLLYIQSYTNHLKNNLYLILLVVIVLLYVSFGSSKKSKN